MTYDPKSELREEFEREAEWHSIVKRDFRKALPDEELRNRLIEALVPIIRAYGSKCPQILRSALNYMETYWIGDENRQENQIIHLVESIAQGRKTN
jgi:hypothetical protein